MGARLIRLLWVLAALLLLGCSRPVGKAGGAGVAHQFDGREWIIELPDTASDQEVISNYFGVLLLQDGKPVATEKVILVGSYGKRLAETTNVVQKIRRYSITERWSGFCPGGLSKIFLMDTDQGQKLVTIELARNHSEDPKATGWRCAIEDAHVDLDTP